ncbi:transposase-like protein [Methylobacterium goesingense]|uniref:Transposase-like protein n=1 Tax=Methylobacterium goesingense TaxID=243690 RepID=A0ABV2LB35_9HYPH
MGQVLHGSATTTEAIRRAIQHSQASLRALSKRYGINPKTVAKWRQRTSVADQRTGPKDPRSTVLSPEDEAVVVAFRRHTLLPLDDCLYALQATIPHLTRSSLHRCLQRHGISRLPEVDGDKPKRSRFKVYPLGYFHIDLAEVHTAEGRLYLFVAIDRTTKFAFVELHEKATRRVAGDFLRHLIEAVPYKVHTVLTDNVLRSEKGRLARQQVSVREHAPAVCLSSTSIQAAPADPEELSAIANTGSSRRASRRGPHRPQHEMSIQAGDPSIIYRVVVLTPVRRQHLWDRLRVFTNGGWLVHRSP